MARPAHKPDPASRRQVEALTAYGATEVDIARVLGIDPKTLRKHYRDELDTGAIKATSKVAESLYRKAIGDGPQSVTAAIFWLKTRGGWAQASGDKIDDDKNAKVEPIAKIETVYVRPERPGEPPAARPS
jgi:hypothetical protein